MVVNDHVAVRHVALEASHEAADVPGQRADVHRRRVGLAQLPAFGVEDAGAEILRLADDRGVAHPEEDARHLLGDRVKGAAEHPPRARVNVDALGRPRLTAYLVVDDRHRRSYGTRRILPNCSRRSMSSIASAACSSGNVVWISGLMRRWATRSKQVSSSAFVYTNEPMTLFCVR